MENKYYQKYKEKLRKEASERYQNLSEKQKERKRQYHCERQYHPFLKKGEKKQVQYMRNNN